ncbi:CD4-2 molecule, tandem duplicate 2 [Cyclopterus lumpus]|uniref:Ig-like domain-containing protein n=1 Tax=Cyclopterus lumpus TaxID=8103 RepID=A0A8C2X1I8_CYCLU|nr:CD4-2 molecule, tandem duplicate 2 [Cyclopterus lumpus]XP_034409744.1 CD4-2 molecule, tandem duplicate 2 [Cyclopterus lumpus]
MKTIVWFVLAALPAAAKVILTHPGHRATLECGVSSFTDILEWQHGADLLRSISGKSGISRKGTGDVALRSKVRSQTKLEISPVKEGDAGKFVCNADGSRQEHTLLVVSVWASPSADLQLGSEVTLHCQVKGLDRDSTVRWTRPDGSPHSGSLESVTLSDAGTWQCTFSQEGGMYNQNLAIRVQGPAPETAPSPSPSPKDVSVPTCLDCVTHPPPSAGLLLGLSWWVWVAVGGGCLTVVLLMVFVIVLSKRIKRKKRNCEVMKNGRQPLKPKSYCQCDCPAAAAKSRQGRRREKPSAPPLPPLLML